MTYTKPVLVGVTEIPEALLRFSYRQNTFHVWSYSFEVLPVTCHRSVYVDDEYLALIVRNAVAKIQKIVSRVLVKY